MEMYPLGVHNCGRQNQVPLTKKEFIIMEDLKCKSCVKNEESLDCIPMHKSFCSQIEIVDPDHDIHASIFVTKDGIVKDEAGKSIGHLRAPTLAEYVEDLEMQIDERDTVISSMEEDIKMHIKLIDELEEALAKKDTFIDQLLAVLAAK